MNKILLVEDINIINSGTYFIDALNNRNVEINGEVILYHVNENNSNLNIKIHNNSRLIFHKIDYINDNSELTILIQDDSYVDFEWLIINCGKNTVKLNVKMRGNRSSAKLKVRIINRTKEDKINFICNGIVLKNTCDNELLEDLKGLIIQNDEIKISPNMEIYTSEVMANHLVTIGSFALEDLFYLTSKGLSIDTAKKLLTIGFASQVCDEINKEYIKTEVINIE